MKKLLIMALLAVLFVGSAQAATTYSEDWEGAAAYPTSTQDVAFGFLGIAPGSNPVAVDTGPMLGTNVAHLPSMRALSAKTLAGLADELITLQYDGYMPNIVLGKGMVGLRNSSIAPGTDGANGGIFVGGNGSHWRVDLRGITPGSGYERRLNITTGGSPGVGADFLGATGVAFTVKTVVDRLAGANGEIRIDILDRATQVSLNPTFTVSMTAVEKANVLNLDQVALYWNSDWTYSQQLVEVDNVGVVSVPEPATMILLGLGGLTLLRRRRG